MMRKNHFAFTLVELMIAAGVVVMIFMSVLASYRHGDKSSQLDVALKQTQQVIDIARTRALAGKTHNNAFPAGGYGVHVAGVQTSALTPFVVSVADGNFSSGVALTNEVLNLRSVRIIALCGVTENTVTSLPCTTGEWQTITDGVDIIFSNPGAQYSSPSYSYVGGILEHMTTGKQAYFYVSLLSGVVSGGYL